MENNIEVKKAWTISYNAEVAETVGFEIEEESTNYGSTSPVRYYMGKKGWIKASSWDNNVVFTEEEAQIAMRKRMEDRLKDLKANKTATEEQIAKYEAELANQ